MEFQYFLEQRTEFIRYYYQTAASAFIEIKRKIEAQEAPFDGEMYDETGEPMFLEEWSAAEDGLNMLGRSSITMLKQAMDDYFKGWVDGLGVGFDEEDRAAFKGGMLNGYRRVFETLLGVDWSGSGADLEVLEQVVLARNAEQHETSIASLHARHPKKDVDRFGDRLRFVSEIERRHRELRSVGEEGFEEPLAFWLGHIEVTKEDLEYASAQLEKLVAFLEPKLNMLR